MREKRVSPTVSACNSCVCVFLVREPATVWQKSCVDMLSRVVVLSNFPYPLNPSRVFFLTSPLFVPFNSPHSLLLDTNTAVKSLVLHQGPADTPSLLPQTDQTNS